MSLSPGLTVLLVVVCITFGYFVFWQYKFWAYHFKIRRIEKRALDKAKGVVPVLLPTEYYRHPYHSKPISSRKHSTVFIDGYKTALYEILFAYYPKYLPYKTLDGLIERVGLDRHELEKVIYYCVEAGIIEMKKRRLGCFKLKDDIYFSIKETQLSQSYDQKCCCVGATLAVAQRGTDRPKRAGASPAPTTD